MLSILSGLPLQSWLDVDLSKVDFQRIEKNLDWINSDPDLENRLMPKYIRIGEVRLQTGTINTAVKGSESYRVPKELRIETFGQKNSFDEMCLPILQKTGSILTAIPIALAIYFQPAITGKRFDPDTLEPIIKACKKAYITEAFPVAKFFFQKSVVLTRKKTGS